MDPQPHRLAVISDVHADVYALRDALAQIERLGCDRIVCCGDLVDYGKHPEETVALLRERGIPCIRGNHDRWALEAEAAAKVPPTLTPATLDFLRSLPTKLDFVCEWVRIAVRHGQHHSDMEGVYPSRESPEDLGQMLAEADADVLLVGHTHLPFRMDAAGGGIVCNPGALLRDPIQKLGALPVFNPKTGAFESDELPAGGTFGILELPSRRFTIHRAADAAVVAPAARGDGGQS